MLGRLEKNPHPVFSERELRTQDDVAFGQLRHDGLLVRRRVTAPFGLYSDVMGTRVVTIVEDRDGSYEAYDEDDPEFEPVPVSVADLPRWEVNLQRLIAQFRVANQFGKLSGRLEERLILLGTGPDAFAVVLALLPNERLARPFLLGLPNYVPPGHEGVLALCPTFVPSVDLARELSTVTVQCALLDENDPFTVTPTALAEIGRLAARRYEEQFARQTGPIRYSPGFRSVRANDKTYGFSPQQATVVEILYRNWRNGTPDVAQQYLLARLGNEDGDLRDTFRRCEAWGELIVPGKSRGTLRLNVPLLSGE